MYKVPTIALYTYKRIPCIHCAVPIHYNTYNTYVYTL